MSRYKDAAEAQDEDAVVDTAALARVGMEHRQGIRCRMSAAVRIHLRDARTAGGIVYDISRGGMFVRCAMVPGISACVDIEVTSIRGVNGTIRIPGLVVHCRADGFGVIFRQLDPVAREFVEHSLR